MYEKCFTMFVRIIQLMYYSAQGESRDCGRIHSGSASNGRGMMQESRQESIMVRWSRLADKRTTIAMLVGRFASKSRQFLRNGCQTGRHYHTPWFFSSDRPWRLTLLALACDPKRCSFGTLNPSENPISSFHHENLNVWPMEREAKVSRRFSNVCNFRILLTMHINFNASRKCTRAR